MGSFKNITSKEFMDALNKEGAIILDVRTPMEVAEGKIPGALHLDFNNPGQFITGIRELDEEKAYYVYCRSGARSAAACAHMSDIGFIETYNLIGGILEWNGPIEK